MMQDHPAIVVTWENGHVVSHPVFDDDPCLVVAWLAPHLGTEGTWEGCESSETWWQNHDDALRPATSANVGSTETTDKKETTKDARHH